MTKEIKVGNDNVVIYLPDNNAGNLRSIIFIPGIGEQNSNVAGLYYNGPLAFIKNGWTPDFAVIGIQPSAQWPPVTWTDDKIKYLLANYPLDPNAICLTGLSAGAKAVHDYVSSGLRKLACTITFSIDLYQTPAAQWQTLPAWGLCGDQDGLGFFPIMSNAWKAMSAWPNKPWTTMTGYGHNGWNDFYKPEWGLYDWMKLFKINNNMTYNAVGVQIEAEAWSAQSGTANEPSTEAGQDVGYIDNGDWLEYPLDVPADGNYSIDFRVASPFTNAKFQILAGGVAVGNGVVPKTGNWQSWQTISVPVSLKKGQQIVRLLSQGDGWNINWLKVNASNAPSPAKTLIATIQIYSDGSIVKI